MYWKEPSNAYSRYSTKRIKNFIAAVLRECLSHVYPDKDKKPIRIKKKTVQQEAPKTNTGETLEGRNG